MCVTETEGEKEGNIVSRQCPFKLGPSPPRYAANSTAIGMVACVTSEKEKEDYSNRYGSGHAGSLLYYPL